MIQPQSADDLGKKSWLRTAFHSSLLWFKKLAAPMDLGDTPEPEPAATPDPKEVLQQCSIPLDGPDASGNQNIQQDAEARNYVAAAQAGDAGAMEWLLQKYHAEPAKVISTFWHQRWKGAVPHWRGTSDVLYQEAGFSSTRVLYLAIRGLDTDTGATVPAWQFDLEHPNPKTVRNWIWMVTQWLLCAIISEHYAKASTTTQFVESPETPTFEQWMESQDVSPGESIQQRRQEYDKLTYPIEPPLSSTAPAVMQLAEQLVSSGMSEEAVRHAVNSAGQYLQDKGRADLVEILGYTLKGFNTAEVTAATGLAAEQIAESISDLNMYMHNMFAGEESPEDKEQADADAALAEAQRQRQQAT